MRYPFVLAFGALAAGCAAPPEASPPESSPPALEALGPAPAVSEADADPLESSLDDRALDFTPSEPIGEAQAAVAWPLVLLGACWVAGTWAAEYGCKKHVLESICPPGSVIVHTVRDTLDKTKTVTVRIPCDVLEVMICGTGGLTAGEVMRRMCAGILQ